MALESTTDEDLLRRFLEGHQSSFAELMRRHEDRVFGMALRMLGERSDALDATQDAFIAAFQKAPSFRFDAAFGTWLYRIGINCCHDLLRKRKRLSTSTLDEQAEGSDQAASTFDVGVVDRLELSEALAQLPAEYREAVVLHDIGAVPYEEIAEVTKAPIGTVKSRISRGRRQLAALLEHPPASEESNPT